MSATTGSRFPCPCLNVALDCLNLYEKILSVSTWKLTVM